METLEAILDMNKKHPPGRRSRSISDLCARVEALETASERLSACATAALDMCERMETERTRLVSCAGAAINAWVEDQKETPADQAMAALARLLIEMEGKK